MKNSEESTKGNKEGIEEAKTLFYSTQESHNLIISNDDYDVLDTTEQLIVSENIKLNSLSYVLPYSQDSNTNVLAGTTTSQEFSNSNKILSSRTHLSGNKNEAVITLKHSFTEENISKPTPIPILPNFSRKNDFQLKTLPEFAKWKFWMAALLIERCRDISSDSIAKFTIINELNLITYQEEMIRILDEIAGSQSIFAEMRTRIDAIQNPQLFFNFSLVFYKQRLFNKETEQLNEWFNRVVYSYSFATGVVGNTPSLNSKIEELRTQQRTKLQNILLSLQHVGPRHLLNVLRELDIFLCNLVYFYDQQRYESLKRIDLAETVYYKLSRSIVSINIFQVNIPKLKDTLKALFEHKLKAEINNQICRLIGETREQINFYSISATQSDTFLADLQNLFEKNSLETPFFAPLIERYLEQISICNFLNEIEEKVGYPLIRWNQFNLEQTQYLQQKILESAQILCENLYRNCYCKLVELEK